MSGWRRISRVRRWVTSREEIRDEQHLRNAPNVQVDLLRLMRQVNSATDDRVRCGNCQGGLALLKRPFEDSRCDSRTALLGDVPQTEDARKILAWSQRCGDITLEFTLSRVESDLIDLRVQVQHRGGPVKSGRITVRSGEAIVQSVALSENGSVVLRQLEPISYDFEITTPGQEAITCSVTLFPMDEENEA